MVAPLRLKPVFKERVWGGFRLNPEASSPIGEAWVVFDECRIDGGIWEGATLADVVGQRGKEVLGEHVLQRTGGRFPLLIKLLDAQDWLSVQVHPDDEQARQFEGNDEYGKTEAWYILKADEGARLVSGLNGTPTGEELRAAAEGGTLEQLLRYQQVSDGDVIYIPAGRVHAIGPGLLIYEVQQASDITYRLFDWNRPASAGRELHLDRGVAVTVTSSSAPMEQVSYPTLVHCPYFTLEEVVAGNQPVHGNTGGMSFHALTVISGEATLRAGDMELGVKELETVLVPAEVNAYELEARGAGCRVLRASVI